MPIVRVQVAIPMKLPDVGADVIQNTWHLQTRAPATALDAAQDFRADVENLFYKGYDQWLSNEIVENVANVKAYNLDDLEPRSPIMEDTLDIAPIASDPLPPQLAVCVSYRAQFASGAPKARRRGRVYTGGYAVTAANADDGQVKTDVITDLVAAGAALMAASDASDSYQWVVYSVADAIGRTVTGGWVDNAWDIQRRRQLERTALSPWGAGH